jgi:Icc-related predicted phosphoesterase
MKIQVLSDMHIEFWKEDRLPEVVGDVLVLPGDICAAAAGKAFKFFKQWLSTITVPVIYVFGNHEYYGSNFDEVPWVIKDYLKDLNHVHILDADTVEIDGITFIGATLWTKLGIRGELIINQSKMDIGPIQNFTVEKWNKSHQRDSDYIRHVLQNYRSYDHKIVVVTHHSPSYKSVSPRFMGDALNVGFHNSLEHLIIDYEPTLWLHGHTHDPLDYMIRDTRIICNPMGYPRENTPPGFDPGKIIDV